MKHFSLLISIIALLFCSCNNKEPDLEIELPINAVFIPMSVEFDRDEMDQQEKDEIMNLVNNKHIVNDISELPNDPIGGTDVFHKINFQDNTLLITYIYHRWIIETYSNRFYRNTEENTYNWVVKLGINSESVDYADNVQLTRFAILVRKLPANAKVETWSSHTDF